MELSHTALQGDWLAGVVALTTSLTAACAVLLGGVWLVWRATQSQALRCAAVILLAVGAFAALGRTPVPTDQGTWACKLCGGSQEELRYLGYTLFRSPLLGGSCRPREAPEADRGCEHEWVATGCHFRGRDTNGGDSVACYLYPIWD